MRHALRQLVGVRGVGLVLLGLVAMGTVMGCSSKNLCVDRNVRCEAPLLCDPGDGVCKCGGRGGVVCQEDFVCDSISNTCQSTKCGNVTCAGGTSCDVLDGICKCGGTGGKECGAGTVCHTASKACVPAQDCSGIICPTNQTCDVATARCLCAGQECSVGQSCSIAGRNGEKTCVNDLCAGVACSGKNVCDSSDGFCKCNGVICQSGEACVCPSTDGGTCVDSARVCKTSSACNDVSCGSDPNKTCDPADGQCKCGGQGGPVCSTDQICSLGPPAQCQGGAQCSYADGGVKACAGGTSCDPEDGLCKCGGRGGQVCAAATATDPAEICVSSSLQQACRRPCDPRTPDCPSGTYCYVDSSAKSTVAYCLAPTESRGDGQSCLSAAACFIANPPQALHCTGLALGSTGICRSYCDVALGLAGCLQVPTAKTCVQIPGATTGYGYCQPQ